MIKIIFFIGSLVSGGKERRFIELLTYLNSKGNYDMLVVTTSSEMHFPIFDTLEIKTKTLKKSTAFLGLTIPFELFLIIKEFKPHLIHSWGRMQNFYLIPSCLFFNNFKLINGQITNATKQKKLGISLLDKVNFYFSHAIVANSHAGLKSYSPPQQISHVILNGMNFKRFENLPEIGLIKEKYKINTPFAIIMVATFSQNKDYDRFFLVAEELIKIRDDVTFLAVGTYHKTKNAFYLDFKEKTKNNVLIKMTGLIHDVEALVNACDIGVLFSNSSNHGEGLSNAILEYMALGKPVMANDSGGTTEILSHLENGYLVKTESPKDLAAIINEWLNDPSKKQILGTNGKNLANSEFSILKMGNSYSKLFQKLKDERN